MELEYLFNNLSVCETEYDDFNPRIRIEGRAYLTDYDLTQIITYCPNIIFHGEVSLSNSVQQLCDSLVKGGYDINRLLNLPNYIYLPIHRKLKRYVKICLGRCSLASVMALIYEFYNKTQVTSVDIDFTDDGTDEYYKMIKKLYNKGVNIKYINMLDNTQYIYGITGQGLLYVSE